MKKTRFLIIISALLGIVSCQGKNEGSADVSDRPQEAVTPELTDPYAPAIPDPSESAGRPKYPTVTDFGPVTKTTWKLVGFVDAQTSKVKTVEPDDPKCYMITFDTDSTFSGFSSTNKFTGRYAVDYTKSTLNITEYVGTKINELFDGEKFVASFLSVACFTVSNTGLRLYYDSQKKYLLFTMKN